MTAAAVLAILVATGEASAPATQAMAGAAAEVVGELGRVEIVAAAWPSDAEALRVEREHGVRAVVTVAWADAEHLHAHLRLHAARTDRWIDRELVFVPADTPAERGRALGFAMASMLPEGDPSLPLATTQPEVATPPKPQPPPAPAPNVVEAAAIAGHGSSTGSVGARVSYERFVSERVSLDVALASRFGRVDAIDARTATSSIALGAALWPLAPNTARRAALAVRGELLLVDEAIEHTSAAGSTAWCNVLLPGLGLTLAGTVRLAGPFEGVVATGAELVFGTVDVTVLSASASGTAALGALRAVAQVGVRARF